MPSTTETYSGKPIQAFTFSRKSWTPAQARAWLKTHAHQIHSIDESQPDVWIFNIRAKSGRRTRVEQVFGMPGLHMVVIESAATRKKASKKTSRKKASSKKVTRKKASKKTTRKKASSKKVTRKKASKKTTRKKASTKKVTRKKASKKTTRKKASSKKASKKTTRKKASSKKVTRKKASKKTARKGSVGRTTHKQNLGSLTAGRLIGILDKPGGKVVEWGHFAERNGDVVTYKVGGTRHEVHQSRVLIPSSR